MSTGGKRPQRARRQPPKGRGWESGPRHFGLLETLRPFLSRHKDMVRALIIYAWSLAALLLLYIWLDGTVIFQRFLEFNAQATGFLVSAFDPTATTSGNIVASDAFAISIVEECTSLAPLAIFISAIFAFPAPFSRKLLGIVLGFVVLSAVNLIRTTSLFYIGSVFPSTLEVVHLLVWQSVMVMLAVALWLLWMRRWGIVGRH